MKLTCETEARLPAKVLVIEGVAPAEKLGFSRRQLIKTLAGKVVK